MRYLWAGATTVGMVRDGNEDTLWPMDADNAWPSGETDELLVAGVADGMGGHVGGEIASRVAIEAAATAAHADGVLRLKTANLAVIDVVMDRPALAGMGTTLTLGLFSPDGSLDIGHVGDSRAYLLSDATLRQVTRDHSLVAEMVTAGELTPTEAAVHPYRNVVTRALGLDRSVEVDREERTLQDGDRVLLCTDGLTNMVDDAGISAILSEAATPAAAAEALVEAADTAGGIDNTTVVVVYAVE